LIIQLNGDRAFVVTLWSVLHRLKRAGKLTDDGIDTTLAAMSASSTQITSIKYGFIQVNGIKMHIAEQGQGPLIVLAHGWPELWYRWRRGLDWFHCGKERTNWYQR
jgi:hypothetical protein